MKSPKILEEFGYREFYDKIRHGARIKTSLLNSEELCSAFRPVLDVGEDIMYLTISSGISGTYHSATMAAEMLMNEYPERRIRCFDSLGAGLGVGIQALRAKKLSQEGLDVDEAYNILIKERLNVCEYFIVDDLSHLRRGGRVTALQAVFGTMLSVKPILFGSDRGTIETCCKVKGRANAINTLADKYREKRLSDTPGIVGISHGDCIQDANKLAELVEGIAKPREIIIVPHEPLTGSHVGPGMLALFFYGTSR